MTDVMDTETYVVKASCNNCGWEGKRHITRGMPVETLKREQCPACGNTNNLSSHGLYREKYTL